MLRKIISTRRKQNINSTIAESFATDGRQKKKKQASKERKSKATGSLKGWTNCFTTPSVNLGISSGSPEPFIPHCDALKQQYEEDLFSSYGELIILGYNGNFPHGSKGRLRTKFILRKQRVSKSVKKNHQYVLKNCRNFLSRNIHSINYLLSDKLSVSVEYKPDEETDMFQIGRSTESWIDFVVNATIPGDQRDKNEIIDETISRFACRIIINQNGNNTAKIYAAGFDSSRNIFLGEKAIKYVRNGEIDGLTTNGVLIMHPISSICGISPQPGVWREVSVEGNVYTKRNQQCYPNQIGTKVEKMTNVLKDGTLIDLCGVILLWRSAEGLRNSPTKYDLEEKIHELNAARPRCPVLLNTLIIPEKSSTSYDDKQPYVYLICGHVQGLHLWGQNINTNECMCPLCRQVGPVVKLRMGNEPSFYLDCGPPTFAFNPCGHMASEKTVKYWASVPLPRKASDSKTACPFCAIPLRGVPGYVKLIFQDHIN